MKILFCYPSYYKNVIYLPYVFFKSKQLLKNRLDVEWLEPLIDGSESFDVPYTDVLFLSCYVWNIERNVQVAREAREINPNVVVIAGGPQIPLDGDPFEVYPEFDYICTTEIENVLPHMLDDFNIPGMRSREFNNPPPKRLDLKTLVSPWIEMKDDVIEMSRSLRERGKKIAFLWETNRGCPYKCTFCDWGSQTNSKIRRFDHDVLMQEIEIFREAKIWMVYFADANFGIFKEDLQYITALAESKKTHGYPELAFFSSAKNNKKVVNESYKVLHDAGMLNTAHISFQSTDDEVLESIDRSNIKNEKLKEEIREAYRLGVPLVGTLILGNPGDTLEKFKKSYYDLLELGFHEDIKTQDFMVLPNAPANHPDYIKKWDIKTMERYHIDSPYFNREAVVFPKANYICGSKNFGKEDYIEMQVFSAFMLGAHCLGATRFISLFLRYMHNVPYSEFYTNLWENETIQEIMMPVRIAMEDYYSGKRGVKLIDRTAPDIIAFELMLENHDKVLDICETFLYGRENEMMSEDLITFQKNVIVKWGEQKTFTINFNLEEFYKRVLKLAPDENLGRFDFWFEPKTYKSNHKYHVGHHLDVAVPKTQTKLQWRKSLKRSNERFRRSYKASIIFNYVDY